MEEERMISLVQIRYKPNEGRSNRGAWPKKHTGTRYLSAKGTSTVHSSVRGRFAVWTRKVGPLPNRRRSAGATVARTVMIDIYVDTYDWMLWFGHVRNSSHLIPDSLRDEINFSRGQIKASSRTFINRHVSLTRVPRKAYPTVRMRTPDQIKPRCTDPMICSTEGRQDSNTQRLECALCALQMIRYHPL